MPLDVLMVFLVVLNIDPPDVVLRHDAFRDAAESESDSAPSGKG